jgi:hypothetical protein
VLFLLVALVPMLALVVLMLVVATLCVLSNRRTVKRLERRVQELGVVDTVIREAAQTNGGRHRRHLRRIKAIVLIPLGWIAATQVRRAVAATAAVAGGVVAAETFVKPPDRAELPPAEGAEAPVTPEPTTTATTATTAGPLPQPHPGESALRLVRAVGPTVRLDPVGERSPDGQHPDRAPALRALELRCRRHLTTA